MAAEKSDADAVCGGKDHGGNQVQGGIGVQEGVVAGGGAHDGADDGKRPHAEQQAGRNEAVGQAFSTPAGYDGLGMPVQVQRRTGHPADGQAQDKQDGEFALGQVLGEGADAQRHGGETHGKVQHVAVFLSQPFFQETPCDRSDQDTGGINNCPYHKYGQIYQKFVY